MELIGKFVPDWWIGHEQALESQIGKLAGFVLHWRWVDLNWQQIGSGLAVDWHQCGFVLTRIDNGFELYSDSIGNELAMD